MKTGNGSYSVAFDEHNQTVVFRGTMRPRAREEFHEAAETIMGVAERVAGSLYLDFKRLTGMNNTAFKELASCLHRIAVDKPDLKLKLLTTSVIAWSTSKFGLLADMSPNISVEQYDKNFYPGQGAIENESFIPVLRTQTKIIWQQEKEILKKHGLRRGMCVADICCGIGDFAVELHKEFEPTELVAVDHSKPSLEYARHVAREFGIKGIDYTYGDAAALMLEDNYFDFVTCRLSLQIFDKPELILKELHRICKPGGRVYLTNETYSKCFAEPHAKSVGWTYKEASRLFGDLGMNLEFGTKMNRYMHECNFADVKVEPMILTNVNSSPEEFGEVIRSWEEYVVGQLAKDAGEDEAFCRKLTAGFKDHIRAVTHPKGFGGWPIWVASAMKAQDK